MQHQIADAIKELKDKIAELEKQIAEAKKNKGDSESLKEMEDELAMLKKQLSMMGGVNKNLSNMSDKTIQQAMKQDSNTMMFLKKTYKNQFFARKILTDEGVAVLYKRCSTEVEKSISLLQKSTEALKIYDETKTKYKSVAVTANAASGCWMIGHWEKALYIMGRVCMEDILDADNLNNYASFLISTGGEQAALPILQYLNAKFPDNSTILNNIGQAWFGLGDLDNAKKYLNSATVLYPNHSLANNILSKIYQSQGDTTKAIAFFKNLHKGSL